MKRTLVDLFESSVKQYANNTFLLEKIGKEFQPTTYAEVQKKVYQLGAGLQALGVKKGDTMALLSEGRNMWIIDEELYNSSMKRISPENVRVDYDEENYFIWVKILCFP